MQSTQTLLAANSPRPKLVSVSLPPAPPTWTGGIFSQVLKLKGTYLHPPGPVADAVVAEVEDVEVGGRLEEGDEGVLLLLLGMTYKSGRERLRWGRFLLLLFEGDCW
jgi:hypothetical protein